MSLIFLQKETLIRLIENSEDTKLFRSLVFKDENDEVKDILENGNVSCAYYVSSLLTLTNYIEKPHSTVAGLVKTLEGSEKFAKVIENYQKTDIVVWEELEANNWHRHLGFYWGNDLAVSNDWETGTVKKHHFTYGSENGVPVRKILFGFRIKE